MAHVVDHERVRSEFSEQTELAQRKRRAAHRRRYTRAKSGDYLHAIRGSRHHPVLLMQVLQRQARPWNGERRAIHELRRGVRIGRRWRRGVPGCIAPPNLQVLYAERTVALQE